MASVFFKLRVNPNRLAALLNRSNKICASASVWATNAQSSAIISRLTPRLLSFALCLEWINGIITLHTLAVWSVIERTLQWTRPRWKSIASTSIVEHARNTDTIYTVKIVNKRPRNLISKRPITILGPLNVNESRLLNDSAVRFAT